MATITLGPIYGMTLYNNKRRLPTHGITPIPAEPKLSSAKDEPVLRHAGWIAGHKVAGLLDQVGCKIRYVEGEKGCKFEAFMDPRDPEAESWLTEAQASKVLGSLERQNVGVVEAYINPQGIMLILTPLSNQMVGEPSYLGLEAVEGRLMLTTQPAKVAS